MTVAMVVHPIRPDPRTLPLAKLQRVETEVKAALEGPVKTVIVTTLKAYTVGWRHKPGFSSKVTVNRGAGSITLMVQPSGKSKLLWIYVSAGVAGRPITAVRAKRLVIRAYVPHTRPGPSVGGPGKYASYKTATHPHTVNWKGIVARRFEVDAVKKLEPGLVRFIRDVIWSAILR